MNLLEAITYLRRNILDDTGGIGVAWQTFTEADSDTLQLRWTNEELTANVNEAIRQVYRRILPVKEVNASFDITTVASTREYSLDARILQIEGIRCKTSGRYLTQLDIKDVWGYKSFEDTSREPEGYIPNYISGSISLYPTPDAIYEYELLVYRLPLAEADWTSNTTELELRDEFVVPMLWYAAHLCYDKDEVNTLDPNRSLHFLQKFTQEFVATSAYSDTRKRNTTNRSIRYGGL